MEILSKESVFLSNYEVMTLIQDQKAQRQENEVAGTKEASENLRTVEFEVQKYLASGACSTQNAEQIAECKRQFAAYDLMKVELLQIINLRPRTLVELLLIVEEFEDRFHMSQGEEMLHIIVNTLLRDDDVLPEEGEEGYAQEEYAQEEYPQEGYEQEHANGHDVHMEGEDEGGQEEIIRDYEDEDVEEMVHENGRVNYDEGDGNQDDEE